jgi:hypothetical protein
MILLINTSVSSIWLFAWYSIYFFALYGMLRGKLTLSGVEPWGGANGRPSCPHPWSTPISFFFTPNLLYRDWNAQRHVVILFYRPLGGVVCTDVKALPTWSGFGLLLDEKIGRWFCFACIGALRFHALMSFMDAGFCCSANQHFAYFSTTGKYFFL